MSMNWRRPAAVLLALLLVGWTAPSHGQERAPEREGATPEVDGTVTSQHTLTLEGGEVLTYTARAGFIPLRENISDTRQGEIFFVAYTAEPEPGTGPRPLTFAWGGGPGSPATLSDRGPRQMRGEDSYDSPPPPYELEDNPNSWVAFTDLVLIDPIGTGYSRMSRPELAALFYNARGDAESITEFIRIYLARYDRSDPPVFLAGGSYGTIRAALVASSARRRAIPVHGLILSASALTTRSHLGTDLENALLVPAFTAAAFEHGKLGPDLASDLDAALEAAEEWALQEYIGGLAQGNRLGDRERRDVIEGLGRFTGLGPEVIEANDLRIPAEVFARELLREEGLAVGHYDTRTTAPLREGPWDPRTDPSLRARGRAAATMLERLHLAEELGVETDRQYAGPFGGGWPACPDWGSVVAGDDDARTCDWMAQQWQEATEGTMWHGMAQALPALLESIEEDPDLRVLIAGGLYDLQTPYFGAEYVASRVQPERRSSVSVVRYPSGHSMPPDAWREDVASFIDAVVRGVPFDADAR